jgi:hypothetical protein
MIVQFRQITFRKLRTLHAPIPLPSRPKGAKIKRELAQSGCDPSIVNAIHAPAGLDFHAATPEKVAKSIFGQMIQFRRASLPQAMRSEFKEEESEVLIEVISQASADDPGAEQSIERCR